MDVAHVNRWVQFLFGSAGSSVLALVVHSAPLVSGRAVAQSGLSVSTCKRVEKVFQHQGQWTCV